MVVQLDKIPERFLFRWSNSEGSILIGTGNRNDSNKLKRSEFISSNATVRMNNLSRTDDGEYKFEIYNEDGVRTAFWNLQLNIQGTFD